MWKDDFVSIMSGATISLDDIERAMTLKDENLPAKIYKFRGFNENALSNFYSDTVWLCSADNYNDPYECCTTIDFEALHQAISKDNLSGFLSWGDLKEHLTQVEISQIRESNDPMRALAYSLLEKDGDIPEERRREVVEELVGAHLKRNNDYYQRFNKRAQKGTKICSFSERVDSVVMWGHYADNHQGFCLEYDVKDFPPGDVRRRILYPVIYSDQLFDATEYILQSMRYGDFNNLFGAMAAIHKSPDWAYEKEWRFVIPMGDSCQGKNYAMPQPSALYLGARIQEDKKETLVEIARKKGVPVYEMDLSPTEFRLKPRLYERKS